MVDYKKIGLVNTRAMFAKAVDGFLEHLAGIHETDFLVVYHNAIV